MARGRKGGGGNIILMIVMVVLLVVAAITPIILIVGYIYYLFKLNGVKKYLSNSVSDFWLDDEEKKLFLDHTKNLALADKTIEKAKNKGIKAGVSLNMDGSFSARSNIGKEIRSTLEQYEPIRAQLSCELEEIVMTPESRWNCFNTYAQRAFAFFWAFCCWAITFAVTVIVNLSQQKTFTDTFPQVALIAAGVAILSFFILYFAARNRGNAYSPKPPNVSLENINSY